MAYYKSGTDVNPEIFFVGLSDDDMENLAKSKGCRKVSRRDLSDVLSKVCRLLRGLIDWSMEIL